MISLLRAAQASDKFDDLARRAYDALDSRPAEAADLYRQALLQRPEWAEGWLYQGASLFQLGRFREARDSFRKGAALEPQKGTPVAFLGMAEYELGDYRPALADLSRGEEIGLADRPAFVSQVRCRAALIHLRFAEFPEALEQLRPLAVHRIESPEALQILGLTVLHLPYLPSTLPEERRALVELAGRAAWVFLGAREAEAEPLFEQLATRFPGQPGVHYLRGVYLMNHDAHGAEQEFRDERGSGTFAVLARVQLSQLLAKDGAIAASVETAREAARLQPDQALCQANLGRALLDAGNIKGAVAALEKAERLAPQAARTHFYLMRAYTRAGRTGDVRREKNEWDRLHGSPKPAEALVGAQP